MSVGDYGELVFHDGLLDSLGLLVAEGETVLEFHHEVLGFHLGVRDFDLFLMVKIWMRVGKFVFDLLL